MLANNNQLLALFNFIGLNVVDELSKCAPCFNNKHVSCIDKLTIDSRLANSLSIFIAIFGSSTEGHQYIQSAARNGCQFALVETRQSIENGTVKEISVNQSNVGENISICCVYVHDLRQKLADIAYSFYTGEASLLQRKMPAQLPNVIGITGTNGKTSVAAIIAQLISLCDVQSASIGTLGVNAYKKGQQTKLAETINTTPDIVSLVGTLSMLQKRECEYVTLEASSHGLAQNRLNKLNVECAVFTNLSQDHLDYHGSMLEYSKAKRQLLNSPGLRTVILNADDEASQLWLHDTTQQHTVYWFSLQPLSSSQLGCWASDISYSTHGIRFVLNVQFDSVKITYPVTACLIGAFNVANLLAALTTLLAKGFAVDELINAVESVSGVAGRMELFPSNKASVLVDYAHTPDALEQALLAARVHTKGTLTCIFGCGGDRDSSKRSIMGSVAQQYADNIVLTQDNSRSEDPVAIIAQIKSGIESNETPNVLVELDRTQAIANCLANSQLGDMILVAGKGHENHIEIDNQRIAYNEREVVAKLIAQNKAQPSVSITSGGAR